MSSSLIIEGVAKCSLIDAEEMPGTKPLLL